MDSVHHARFDAVFLDFEGTLNDTQASGRLYARDFVATVGRAHKVEPGRWFGAIVQSLTDLRAFQDAAAAAPWPGYDAHRRRELLVWIRSLYGAAGVPIADDDDQAYQVARELELAIPVRFAPLPGAAETVRALADRGLRLYIASGANSRYVSRCLSGAGLLELFSGVYGPDNLDTLKSDALFFRLAFAAAMCRPERCLVVDDSPGPVCWARELGATAVYLGALPDGPEGDSYLRLGVMNLSSLVELLSVVDGSRP